MDYYLATTVANAAAADALSAALAERGHTETYNWRPHLNDPTGVLPGTIAHNEITAVIRADVVVVCLPGGRGTHIELGAALALNKDVLLCGTPDLIHRPIAELVPFYFHSKVMRVELDWTLPESHAAIAGILELMAGKTSVPVML